MSPLRIAVIGAGHLGRIHTRLIRSVEGVELVGVVDPLAEARDRIAAEFGVPTSAQHRDLLGRADAAIIAATTAQHYAIGRDLLEHGVHLLVEKPLTATVAEADELVALARSQGAVLQVGHVERFNPAWSAVSAHLHRPRYFEAVRASGYTFRSTDVSVVLDLMIHDLDLVLSVVRSPVVAVDAVGATIFGPHADLAHAHLQFANGCVANLNASRTSFQAQRTMNVITDRAFVGVDFATGQAKLVLPSRDLIRGRVDVHRWSREEQERVRTNLFTELLPLQEIAVEKRNAILDEQQEFVDCIRHGRTPRVSGQQARDCLAVADQILESIARKRRQHPTRHDATPIVAPRRPPATWPDEANRRKAG